MSEAVFRFGTERSEVQILSPRQIPSDGAGLERYTRCDATPRGVTPEDRPAKRDFRKCRLTPTDPIARFWVRVDRRSDAECWEWLAGRVTDGYGRFHFYGKPVPAHRFAYEITKGPIPAHLHIDHLCRNHGCVNPSHLEAVRPQVNVLRGIGHSAENARKSTCIRGHRLAGENLRIVCGRRICMICRRASLKAHGERKKQARKLLPQKPRKSPPKWTHCHMGHALTEDNRTRGGKGRCRECRRIAGRAYWARRTARQAVTQ